MFLGRLDDENIKEILESISDGIQIFNGEGYLVYCNSKCELLDDIKVQKAIGRHVSSIYPPCRDNERTVSRVLRTGVPIVGKEQNYVNYLGRKLTAVISTLPLLERERIVGVIEITRSLTENRELAEAVERLKLETEAWRASSGVGAMLAERKEPHRERRGDRNGGSSADGFAANLEENISASVGGSAEKIAAALDKNIASGEFGGYEQALRIFETSVIESALKQSEYNISECAKLLRIPRQTLQYKVRKLGIKMKKAK